MAADIPVGLRKFVTSNITSLHQLEVLLLVSALPDREWSVEAVYGVVLSNITVVAVQMEDFVKAGMFRRSGDPPLYRYAPQSAEIGNLIAALGAIYKTDRHKIVELIYLRQSDPLKVFSDAFKINRDK